MKKRYVELDVYRGLAVVMMVVFHFVYDLRLFKVVQASLYLHPFWLLYRHFLVFLFLGVTGACLYLVHGAGIQRRKLFVRTGKLLLCAAAITGGTYYLNRPKYVYFGVLHFLAVAGLLALPFLKRRQLCFYVAVSLLAVGFVGDLGDSRNYIPHMGWLGFGKARISSYDLFPLIPYFGYVLLGIYLVQGALKESKAYLFYRIPQNRATRTLAFIGKYALIIYLVHQPLLLGAIHVSTGRTMTQSWGRSVAGVQLTAYLKTESKGNTRILKSGHASMLTLQLKNVGPKTSRWPALSYVLRKDPNALLKVMVGGRRQMYTAPKNTPPVVLPAESGFVNLPRGGTYSGHFGFNPSHWGLNPGDQGVITFALAVGRQQVRAVPIRFRVVD